MRKVILFLVIILFTMTGFSQNKFGSVDFNKIVQSMPETADAKVKLEKTSKEIKGRLDTLATEYNTKAKAFEVYKKEQHSDALIKEKEQELQSLGERYAKFQESANKALSDEQNILLTPIIDKVKKHISDKSKEKKLTVTFEKTNVNYTSDEVSDITDEIIGDIEKEKKTTIPVKDTQETKTKKK